jgi:hypothetical protein
MLQMKLATVQARQVRFERVDVPTDTQLEYDCFYVCVNVCFCAGPFTARQKKMLDRQGVFEFHKFAGKDYTYAYRDDLCKESKRLFDARSVTDQSTSTGFISCEFDKVCIESDSVHVDSMYVCVLHVRIHTLHVYMCFEMIATCFV